MTPTHTTGRRAAAWATLPLRGALLVTAFAASVSALPAQSIVVANRDSGDLTVHRATDGSLVRTVALPPAANRNEPMYVVQIGGEVVVGDRANDRVVRFDKRNYEVRGEVSVGAGVWHMWSNGGQLWVNCDIDKTTVVLDTHTWRVVRTLPIPPELAAAGYKPHDVVVNDDFAWISLLGSSAAVDWVVQTRVPTFEESGRVAVGKDPHLWWDGARDRLYVPCQTSSRIDVFDATSLHPVQTVAQPGAHGVFLPRGSGILLVTNLPGAGVDDLVAFRTGANGLTEVDKISTGISGAHNIAALPFGLRIAVTHSGATSRKVTLYRLRGLGLVGHPRLERLGDLDAGVNPFGIAMVH